MAKNKPRIAILCDPVGRQVGGSFISAFRFARLLKERGNHVIFLAAKYPDAQSTGYHDGIKVYRFPSVKLPYTENQFYLGFPTKKRIKKIFAQEKIDILHVMIPTPAAIPAMSAAKEMGLGIVAHSHTQPENVLLHLPRSLRSESLNEMFYHYMLWLYRKADVVICPSKMSEELLKSYDPHLKTAVISNGVDLSKFRKTGFKRFLRKYQLSNKDKRILFVGRLHPEKSIHTLIEAMPYVLKHCGDVHLDIVGAGRLMPALKRLAKSLGLEESITFFGKVPDEDLILAYNAADIFVLPSLAELEGMVVLEAMACGNPIIIADAKGSAARYFVKDNGDNGLLFRPGDSRNLAEQAVRILRDDKLREKMADNSYRAARKYDIQRSVSAIEKVYRGLLLLKDHAPS